MGDAALAADPNFATVMERVKRRAETDGKVAAVFATMDVETLSEKLEAADIAFARVNDVAGFIAHPHLRRISVETPSGPVSYPAPAPIRDQPRSYGRDAGAGRAHREGAEGVRLSPHPEERAARRRLEGWRMHRRRWPSFETLAALAPQDEDGDYSITSTATFLPRSDAVEPIANTNGIASTQIAVSSMKSLA